MEEMLKSWFPNVKLQDEVAATQTEEAVSTKKPKVKWRKKLRMVNCCVRAFLSDEAWRQEHMAMVQRGGTKTPFII